MHPEHVSHSIAIKYSLTLFKSYNEGRRLQPVEFIELDSIKTIVN